MSSPVDIIRNYFPEITAHQLAQFFQLEDLYKSWNSKINVISRNDIDHLYERHVLFSLSIAKVISFQPGTKLLDIGTGGGFPGIPLAIFFPQAHFHLVDSIGKKIKVVDEIAQSLKLKNVTTGNARAESLKLKFDFVVSRAVTSLDELCNWTKGKFSSNNKNTLPNGILYLKGGDFEQELAAMKLASNIFSINTFFKEEFFETKKIVYIPASETGKAI